MREINATDMRMAGTSITVAQLADHFQQRELGCSNGRISYSTRRAYQGVLGTKSFFVITFARSRKSWASRSA
jgi:hypothetical protein